MTTCSKHIMVPDSTSFATSPATFSPHFPAVGGSWQVPYVLQEEAIAEVPQQQLVELRREELQPMAEEVLKQVPWRNNAGSGRSSHQYLVGWYHLNW